MNHAVQLMAQHPALVWQDLRDSATGDMSEIMKQASSDGEDTARWAARGKSISGRTARLVLL